MEGVEDNSDDSDEDGDETTKRRRIRQFLHRLETYGGPVPHLMRLGQRSARLNYYKGRGT